MATSYRSALYATATLYTVLSICAAPTQAEGPGKGPESGTNTTVALNGRRFDLSKHDDLKAFEEAVKDLDALAKEQRAEPDTADAKPPSASQGEEKKPERDKPSKAVAKGTRDWSDKKVRRGLKAMERIAKGVLDGKTDAAKGIHDIQEIDWAVESNFTTPYTWRKSLDLAAMVFGFRDLTLNASGRGDREAPASNLVTYDADDLSKVDPKSSTFWSRPASIPDQDLYTGFGRAAIPNFADSICTYDAPHKGYGAHPILELMQNGTKWKVKFGEKSSGAPLGCRIYSALGFPQEIIDYAPEVKVRWDQRILREFNSRKLNAIQLRLLGIPLGTFHKTRYFDPFASIRYAVLKDGSHVDPRQLRERLFPMRPGQHRPSRPEVRPSLYDKDFESRIDYLVMQEACVTSSEKDDSKELGFWDYNAVDHPALREVRAMAILDAWLGNWDIRPGNTRLDLAESSDGSYRLEHIVSDTGGLFGNSGAMIRMVHGKLTETFINDTPNDYSWAFTHPQAPDATTVPIRDYMPATKTEPFYEMNLDDARWMARLIAQLTENQIKQALIGSGYDAPKARLLLEKLVARRDQMVQDLGLAAEIPPLRAKGVDRFLTYDPNRDGSFEAVRPSGQKIVARYSGTSIVTHGTLYQNRKRPSDLSASAILPAAPGSAGK